MIYRTRELAEEFEAYLSSKILLRNELPVLNVIQIGNDFASSKYIEYKKLKCQKLGITLDLKQYHESVNPQEVELYISSLSSKNCGVILQLPVPKQFSYLLERIDPKIDIDLLNPNGYLFETKSLLTPTIGAIDLTLKKIFTTSNNFEQLFFDTLDLTGKTVSVIGQGKLVGKPLLNYLRNRNATIISINHDTKNPKDLSKMADIVITAAGVENLVNKSWLCENVIVIDAATLESNGSQKGDVDKNDIWESTILCPSPGGIGRITILYLIYNLFAFNNWQ
jgi:methylenetetrahydrofolate dehydrogenase (NADP+) / methenyltetrahydrofolate cyclohydrolase